MLLTQRTSLATRAQSLNETLCPATVLLAGASEAVACASTTPRSGHKVAEDGSGIIPVFRVVIRVLASSVATAPKCGQQITLTIAGTSRKVTIEDANIETAEVHWRIVAVSPTA
jgi:hypothetical protein